MGSLSFSTTATLDSGTWYKLSNAEPNHALDVVNTQDNQHGKIELRISGNYSGQLWRIMPITEANGQRLYTLQTMYLGPEKLLDVWGNNPRQPHLADRGNFSGQKWYIDLWPGTDTYKLSNTYGGLYLALDTQNAREVVMAPQDQHSETQRWRFTPAQRVEP